MNLSKQATLNAIFDSQPRETLVMGIINLAPNSFYKPSILNDSDKTLEKIDFWINQGLRILDIGAFSSRPGSKIPDSDTELKTLLPVIQRVCQRFPNLVVSVDTVHSATASACIEAGVEIINDISGGQFDPGMAEIIAQNHKILVLMHMKGTPETMQSKENTRYDQIMPELLQFFMERIEKLQRTGVHKIIIDPGIGFSKTLTDNYKILSNLALFKIIDAPLMIGLSRKSMFWKPENASADDVLPATLTANALAVQQGCRIIRVHDVAEHLQSIRVVHRFQKNLIKIESTGLQS